MVVSAREKTYEDMVVNATTICVFSMDLIFACTDESVRTWILALHNKTKSSLNPSVINCKVVFCRILLICKISIIVLCVAARCIVQLLWNNLWYSGVKYKTTHSSVYKKKDPVPKNRWHNTY